MDLMGWEKEKETAVAIEKATAAVMATTMLAKIDMNGKEIGTITGRHLSLIKCKFRIIYTAVMYHILLF